MSVAPADAEDAAPFLFTESAEEVVRSGRLSRLQPECHQLVRVIEIAASDRMRVELDAAEVRHPGEARRIVDDHLFGSAP
jgi:hypothetical protein